MLVNLNPFMPSTKSKKQTPSFQRYIADFGVINPVKITKNSFETALCDDFIYAGCYQPTLENLKALIDAKKIAAKKVQAIEISDELDDCIETLITKAKEKGQEAFDALKDFIKLAKEQKFIKPNV